MNMTLTGLKIQTGRSHNGCPLRMNSVGHRRGRPKSHRPGSVLLIVLVIVALLTLTAYTYTQTMLTEYEATTMYGSEIQSREAADSGVEYVAALLKNRTDPSYENTLHNPAMFMGRPVVQSQRARGTARFTVIAPMENASTHVSAIRYGLMDESAKLNLNLIIGQQVDDADAEAWLMNIPNMTVEIADAILDWIDTDDTVRANGAESETYQAMVPPYHAKNGPIESLDELLMVRGVTPALLYGEDANRNGLLDPNENDGPASPPMDNGDGILDHGWIAYLTAHARETNLRADGRKKINLNNGLLTDLYDELLKEYDKNVADFVVAVRLSSSGPKAPAGSTNVGGNLNNSNSSNNNGSGSNSNSGGSSGGSNAGSKSGGSNNSNGGGNNSGGNNSGSGGNSGSSGSSAVKQAATAVASALSGGAAGNVTRDGMNLANGAVYQIPSIWVLFGSTVTAVMNGTSTPLTSPWPSDPTQLPAQLPALLDALSISDEPYVDGRINLNQARREILMGIPSSTQGTPALTEQLIEQITAAQQLDANGQPPLEVIQRHNTTGWLYFEGLVSLSTMITLDPWLTARGDVYRAQVFGFFDGGGPITRLEAMIDGTQNPPRIIFQRDLNALGHGYSRMQLLVPTR